MAEEESPWQAYTDGLLETGCCVAATIIGLADGSYWAYSCLSDDGNTSAGVGVHAHIPQPDEALHIVNCLKDSSVARAAGPRIAGNKLFCMKADDEEKVLLLKLGSGGAVCVGATQCAVLAVWGGEGQNMVKCLQEVDAMVTSFKEAGY